MILFSKSNNRDFYKEIWRNVPDNLYHSVAILNNGFNVAKNIRAMLKLDTPA